MPELAYAYAPKAHELYERQAAAIAADLREMVNRFERAATEYPKTRVAGMRPMTQEQYPHSTAAECDRCAELWPPTEQEPHR